MGLVKSRRVRRICGRTSLRTGPDKRHEIPEGSTIFCPGCGTALYKTTNRITPVSIRMKTNLVPLTEKIHTRYPFICHVCNRLILTSSGQYTYAPPTRKI